MSEVGEKVEILAKNKGKKGAVVKIIGTVDQAVVPHNFKLEHNIVRIEKHEINAAEAVTGQIGQHVELLPPDRPRGRNNPQVQVAFAVELPRGCRAKQIDGLNVRVATENIRQLLHVGEQIL